MPTLKVVPARCRPEDLEPAVDWMRRGLVVVYPTDTFYGLAVDPSSSAAVRALFDVKGRDAGMALPLIAASRAQVEAVCGPLSPAEDRLADAFWPGPLSLIVNAPDRIAPEVHAGRKTVAIRVPDEPVSRLLCERWGAPVTATSANRSGHPPARTVDAVGSLIDDPRVLAIDAGPTRGGAPSTLVDARGAALQLVRDGAIAWERVVKSLDR